MTEVITSFGIAIQTVLLNGTYSNYGSAPKSIDLVKKAAPGSLNVGLSVLNQSGPPELTFDGTVILRNQQGSIFIKTRKSTNRDKLKADIYDILKASVYPFNVIDEKDDDITNRYITTLTVTILR